MGGCSQVVRVVRIEGVGLAVLVVGNDPPFDAGVLDPDVFACQLVERLQERGALFGRNETWRGVGFEVAGVGFRLELRQVRFGIGPGPGAGLVLRQVFERVERLAATATANLARSLSKDIGRDAERNAAFRALGEHRSALDSPAGQARPGLPVLVPRHRRFELDTVRVGPAHVLDLSGEYAG